MKREKTTSLDQYWELWQAVVGGKRVPDVQTVQQLLYAMERELLLDGVSPLFGAAVKKYPAKKNIFRWRRRYVPGSFSVRPIRNRLSAHDASVLVSCFAEYMTGKDASSQIKKALPYFCRSTSRRPAGKALVCIPDMLRQLDCEIPRRRRELLEPGAASEDRMQNVASAAGDVQDLKPETGESRSERVLRWQEEKKNYSADILDLQKKLQEINMQMKQVSEQTRRIDSFLTEDSVRKAHINLLELYNLIADIRDSQKIMAEETQNVELETSAYNLEMFLDMISDYLAGYGIRTISTEPGAAFNVTYHAVPRMMKVYDPKTLVVSRSVRNGFAWGEQVLQKEQVEVR